MKRAIFYILIIGCMLMTQWPIAPMANKIDPLLFGMPFSVVWCVGWIVAGCVIALIAAITCFGEGTPEEEKKGGKK